MYEIVKNGSVIQRTKEPIYITKSKNGDYIITCKTRARGVLVNSVPYSLEWAEPIDNLEKVCMRKID